MALKDTSPVGDIKSRDLVAIVAMHGLLHCYDIAKLKTPGSMLDVLADTSYKVADAMIKGSQRHEPKK